jgi:hypothetical protein
LYTELLHGSHLITKYSEELLSLRCIFVYPKLKLHPYNSASQLCASAIPFSKLRKIIFGSARMALYFVKIGQVIHKLVVTCNKCINLPKWFERMHLA